MKEPLIPVICVLLLVLYTNHLRSLHLVGFLIWLLFEFSVLVFIYH